MIYFLQPMSGGPIKIGYSGNVKARHSELRYQFQRKLILLGTLPGDLKEEERIHRRFAHLRIGTTEQFRPGPDLFEFIGCPVPSPSDSGDVEAMSYHGKVEVNLPGNVLRDLRGMAANAGKPLRFYVRDILIRHAARKRKAYQERKRQPPPDESAGHRLRRVRLEYGLTQIEAARRLGVNQVTWSSREIGKQPLTTEWFLRAAKAIGCEPSELDPGLR